LFQKKVYKAESNYRLNDPDFAVTDNILMSPAFFNFHRRIDPFKIRIIAQAHPTTRHQFSVAIAEIMMINHFSKGTPKNTSFDICHAKTNSRPLQEQAARVRRSQRHQDPSGYVDTLPGCLKRGDSMSSKPESPSSTTIDLSSLFNSNTDSL
jgi:hypothetical protein